jgi:hypothetical protein
MTKPTDCVFIGAPSQFRQFMLELVARLKERDNACVHLYCSTIQQAEHFRTRAPEGLFASIECGARLHAAVDDPVPPDDALWARAKEHEAWLGLCYNEFAVSDRHFGRGFALAGFHHPRSRYSDADYRQVTHAYNKAIDFWKSEIAEKRPGLVLWGDRLLIAAAHAENIPVRLLAGSRYRDFHYWSVNEFWEMPAVERTFRRLDSNATSTLEIDAPYHSHVVNRKHFLAQSSLPIRLAKMAETTARYVYWRLRGYEKAKGYYLSGQLAYHLRVWRQIRDLRRGGPVSLKALEGQKFVFFPLQTEPETSLQMLSPEYFFQLEAIASIARDLPAGVQLAVKETFAAVGRRPDNFYDQIRAFKNVVLLEMMELGLDVTRQAEAVITINGSAGLEAAVRGKPVIVFGRHNLYRVLPHVMEVRDSSDLKRYLRNALDGSIDETAAKQAGQRFLQAVIETSFDLRGYDFRRPEDIDPAAVDDAYSRLVAGLAAGAATDLSERA